MLAREAREIRERIRGARRREDFSLETRWAVRMKDFVSEILYEDPDVVHLSGHGSHNGEWSFEDDLGLTEPVSLRKISTVFETLKGKIKVVLFNGCYSDRLALAVTASIDCAVGVRKRIQDSVACNFSAAFYDALASDRSVLTSFKHACNVADAEACEPTIYFGKEVIAETLRLLPGSHVDEVVRLTPAASGWSSANTTSAHASSQIRDSAATESSCNLLVGDTALMYMPREDAGGPTFYRANAQQVALRRLDNDRVILLTHPQPRDLRGHPLETKFQLFVNEITEFTIHFFLQNRPSLHRFRLSRTTETQFNLKVSKPDHEDIC